MERITQYTARNLSLQDLQAFGLNDVAYVKPAVTDEGEDYVVIHAADGTELGSMRNRDTAFAALLQQGLTPLSVH
jgi:hypothetical protein